MKTSFLSILFLLSLLAMAISCKKDRELNPAEEWFTDPTNLPQPPQGCKIVKTTYKTLMLPGDQRPGVETITLEDGRKIKVGTVTTTTFIFDPQGRIVEENRQNLNTYILYRYAYLPKYLIKYNEWTGLADNGNRTGPYMETDTIPINDQNLIEVSDDYGPFFLKYDKNDYLIQTSSGKSSDSNQGFYIYSAESNLVTFQNESLRNTSLPELLTIHYTYLINRPNLPTIYGFRGKESRNLMLTENWEIRNSRDFVDGSLYQVKYTYWYDKLGRVKRRFRYGKALNPQWLIEQDPYGIGVTDYEYRCP